MLDETSKRLAKRKWLDTNSLQSENSVGKKGEEIPDTHTHTQTRGVTTRVERRKHDKLSAKGESVRRRMWHLRF